MSLKTHFLHFALGFFPSNCGDVQWRRDKSAALSSSEICLQEFKMKDHVSCLYEDIRIIKAF